MRSNQRRSIPEVPAYRGSLFGRAARNDMWSAEPCWSGTIWSNPIPKEGNSTQNSPHVRKCTPTNVCFPLKCVTLWWVGVVHSLRCKNTFTTPTHNLSSTAGTRSHDSLYLWLPNDCLYLHSSHLNCTSTPTSSKPVPNQNTSSHYHLNYFIFFGKEIMKILSQKAW